MSDLDAASERVLRKYPKAVAHMRAQKEAKKFGLVFGAGASSDVGFPMWPELVESIASHEKVQGSDLLTKAGVTTTKSQLLFQKFKESLKASQADKDHSWTEINAVILSGWREVLREVLYKKVPPDIAELKLKDKYLQDLLPIIKQTPVTITYNFDDTLERLLSDVRTENEKETSRGYKTIWGTDLQPFSTNGVIYHPNGYLPRLSGESGSDALVFLEDSFGDQLIESVHGHHASLVNHYAHTTCLFIGISLEDNTLKHLLRTNAKQFPGHVHYRFRLLKDGEKIDPDAERCIRDSDYDLYNVIPLFLSREELAGLGKLLNRSDEHYLDATSKLDQPNVYRYFLTGSVSVGKSTAVSHFRSLVTHDEWLDQMLPGMEKDPSKVNSPDTINRIDQFIVDQWRLKTRILSQDKACGIHIIDRTPLDAFAFTPEHEWIKKAEFTRLGVKRELCKGAVILMLGEPRIMAARATRRGKVVTKKKLQDRQELLKVVFRKGTPGVTILETGEMNAKEVAKEIGRIIHLEDYSEFDFQEQLTQIERGIIAPPVAVA